MQRLLEELRTVKAVTPQRYAGLKMNWPLRKVMICYINQIDSAQPLNSPTEAGYCRGYSEKYNDASRRYLIYLRRKSAKQKSNTRCTA